MPRAGHATAGTRVLRRPAGARRGTVRHGWPGLERVGPAVRGRLPGRGHRRGPARPGLVGLARGGGPVRTAATRAGARLLVVAGCAAAWWSRPGHTAAGWWRAWRCHRLLGPLWLDQIGRAHGWT